MDRTVKKIVFISCDRLGWRTFSQCLIDADVNGICDHRTASYTQRSVVFRWLLPVIKGLLKICLNVVPKRVNSQITCYIRSSVKTLDFAENLDDEFGNFHYHWLGHSLIKVDTVPSGLSYSVSVDCTSLQRISEFDDMYLDSNSRLYSKIREQEAQLFSNALFIHATSKWAGNDIRNVYGVPKEKIIVLSPPILRRPQSPSNSTERDLSSATWITFIGNDFERKGGWFLLHLHQKYLSKLYQLHIVGVDKPSFRNYENVTWHGQLDNSEVRTKILPNSRILVLPTKADMSPIVCIEAAAHGVPCIATDVGAISEFVINEYTGFILKKNEQDFLKKIKILFECNDTYLKYSMNSIKHYDALSHGDKIAELLMTRCIESVKAGD